MATEVEALCEVDHTVFVFRILQPLVVDLLYFELTYPFAKLLENIDFY